MLGGLLALLVGAGFLFVPGFGVVMIAGPIAAALLAGVEGGVAGGMLGSLVGGVIGWGVPKDRALHYETHVEAGRFLVVVRSSPSVVARARNILAGEAPHHIDVYEPPAS